MLAKIPNLLICLNCTVHDGVTSVLRTRGAVTEPRGARGWWGRMQLQERQNAGILLFTPKFRANTVQRLLGWAEHSELRVLLPSGENRGLQTACEDGRALARSGQSWHALGTILGQPWHPPGMWPGWLQGVSAAVAQLGEKEEKNGKLMFQVPEPPAPRGDCSRGSGSPSTAPLGCVW